MACRRRDQLDRRALVVRAAAYPALAATTLDRPERIARADRSAPGACGRRRDRLLKACEGCEDFPVGGGDLDRALVSGGVDVIATDPTVDHGVELGGGGQDDGGGGRKTRAPALSAARAGMGPAWADPPPAPAPRNATRSR